MGIFGSQGEYAKLAPLFVDKFDTEPTFSKINRGYEMGDELANIKATNAISQEQGYANQIHKQHQDVISKVNSGEMSPFQYVRQAKETAHNYVNDPIRRTLEMNKEAYDLSKKENQGKVSDFGAEKKSLGLQALQGGGSKGVRYTGYTAKDINLIDLATKAASNANENINANWKGDPVNRPSVHINKETGMLEVSKTEHEYLAREKVAEGVSKMLDSDPEAASFLENTAYGDLYERYDYMLRANPETSSLTEEQRNATIYKKLYSPDPVKYRGKDGKTYTDNRSPLQREIDAKKNQLVIGIAGLKAYDKYKFDFDAKNLPEKSGEDSNNLGQLPSGGVGSYNEHDIASAIDNPYLEGIDDITSGKTYDVESTPIMGGSAAGGYAPSVKSRKNPDEQFTTKKQSLKEVATKYKLPISGLDTATNTPQGIATLKKAAQDIFDYEKAHTGVYIQGFDNNQAKAIIEGLGHKRYNLSGISFDSKTGRPSTTGKLNSVLDKIIDESDDDVYTKSGLKTTEAKRRDLLDNAGFGGVTTYIDGSGNSELAYKLNIAGKTVYARVDDDAVNKAYSDFNTVNKLNKTPTVNELPLLNPRTKVSYGYSPDDKVFVKKQYNPDTKSVQYAIYNKTKNTITEPVDFSTIVEGLNSVALSSLNNHQIQTTFYTENEKVK